MPTVTYDSVAVTVDDEGFFADPSLWTEEMASDIAREAGIETLTDRHAAGGQIVYT